MNSMLQRRATVGLRRAALAFFFVTTFLDLLAIGIVAPVLPKLVLGFRLGPKSTARSYRLRLHRDEFALGIVVDFPGLGEARQA
jgi:hypothetical protein